MVNQIKCPICTKGNLKITTTKIDIPYYGLAYLLTIICDSCHFKTTDVILDKINPPTRFSVKIKNSDDLSIKVIKSSTAVITIPEFGVKMEPGAGSEGFITNIEGILQKFRDLTIMVRGWFKEKQKKKKCDEVLSNLEKAIENELEFTLLLEDFNGNSVLVGNSDQKILKELLDNEEIEQLKKIYEE